MKSNPNLYGADLLEIEMVKAGYVRSPNNIHALPSVHWMEDDPLRGESPIWYAGSAGLPEPAFNAEVQVMSDRIRVFRVQFFGEAYTKASFWDTITLAVFTSVPDFLEWCKAHGTISKPGLPAFANGWD